MSKFFSAFLAVMLSASSIPVHGATLSQRMSGRILLQVEQQGQAWYVNPKTLKRHSLGRPADALQVMRQVGVGITNSDFDRFNGKAPQRLAGMILLKVQDGGKAYYVHPQTLAFYSLGRPADALAVMRQVGLGIRDVDLEKIPNVVISSPDLVSGREISPSSVVKEPESAATESLKFVSADASVKQETQYDGAQVNTVTLDVTITGHKQERVAGEWRVNAVLDAQTVDESGKPATFFNENNLLKIDQSSPMKIPNATFVSSFTKHVGTAHTYTTTLTVRDLIGNQTISKTITFRLE